MATFIDLSAKCRKCQKEVKNGENAITCDVCDGWLHARCVGISLDAEFKKLRMLIKKFPELLKTTCDSCDKFIKNFGKISEDVKNLEKKEEANEQRITKQGHDLSEIQSLLCELVDNTRKEMDEIKKCVSTKVIVKNGEKRASISANFNIDELQTAQQWLINHEFDEEGDCIIRRVLTHDGRSKAYINGHACTLSELKSLGKQLISIHGQHEGQQLLQVAAQQILLDAFGKFSVS